MDRPGKWLDRQGGIVRHGCKTWMAQKTYLTSLKMVQYLFSITLYFCWFWSSGLLVSLILVGGRSGEWNQVQILIFYVISTMLCFPGWIYQTDWFMKHLRRVNYSKMTSTGLHFLKLAITGSDRNSGPFYRSGELWSRFEMSIIRDLGQ